MSLLPVYLFEIRELKKLSLRQLAKLSGLSHGAIQKIESGSTKDPGIEVLEALSKALNVPLMNLVLAWQGKDVERYQPGTSSYKEAFRELYESTPREVLLKVLKHMSLEERVEILFSLEERGELLRKLKEEQGKRKRR